MRYLVTAGPTREPLDDVRYLSNHSSGKLGYAIARQACRLGHEVILLSGPVDLRPPPGLREFVPVTTGQDLHTAAMSRAGWFDIAVMVAAVADFRPRRRKKGKIKKSEGGLTLDLVKTRDVCAALGRRKTGRQLLVAFALEARDPGHRLARAKLERKGADLVVANHPRTLGSDRAAVAVLDAAGPILELDGAKHTVARKLVQCFDAHHPESG